MIAIRLPLVSTGPATAPSLGHRAGGGAGFFACYDATAGRSAGGIVGGFEPRGTHLFFWIAARPLALNKPGVGFDGNQAATHAGARSRPRGRAGTACARRSSFVFARLVAGHQMSGVGVVVADDAQGIGLLAGAGFRGGHGTHSHTRASRARMGIQNTNERHRRCEDGNCSARAHSHTGAPRSVTLSCFSQPAAFASAANGAGRAFFFAVGALVS